MMPWWRCARRSAPEGGRVLQLAQPRQGPGRAGTRRRCWPDRACRRAPRGPGPDRSGSEASSTRPSMLTVRSAASVTAATLSTEDTCSGSSGPPMAARSVASTSRSGPRCSGGSTKLRVIGTVMASSGSSSSGRLFTSSSNVSRVRGSASTHSTMSSGPPHAWSGCRSTSQVWRLEYVSTKCRSPWTWKAVLGHVLLEVGDETVQIDQRHADPLLCWILISATACHDLGHDETVSRSGGIYTI